MDFTMNMLRLAFLLDAKTDLVELVEKEQSAGYSIDEAVANMAIFCIEHGIDLIQTQDVCDKFREAYTAESQHLDDLHEEPDPIDWSHLAMWEAERQAEVQYLLDRQADERWLGWCHLVTRQAEMYFLLDKQIDERYAEKQHLLDDMDTYHDDSEYTTAITP
jgi:hypothetical protein